MALPSGISDAEGQRHQLLPERPWRGMAWHGQAALDLLDDQTGLGQQGCRVDGTARVRALLLLQFLARNNSRRFDSTDQVRHVVAD